MPTIRKNIMKANKASVKIAITAVACVAAAQLAQAVIAYQYPTGNYGNLAGSAKYNVGMDFTVEKVPITVTRLGAFDNGQNGFTADVEVAIYRVSDQVMLASTVFSGSEDELINGSRWQDLLEPVELPVGTYRIVAGGYGGSTSGRERLFTESVANSITLGTDTGGGFISFGGNYYGNWNAFVGIAFPTLNGPSTIPGYAAGTFDFTPVPEASQFAVAGVGLLGLVYVGRCAWQRRKAACATPHSWPTLRPWWA